MIILREKIFGQVKRENKAKKKAWEAKMAGINNPDAPMIIDNPDNPNKIKRYVMQEYNFHQHGDTKNSLMFRDMNQEIRSSSDDLKVLNPEFVDNAERKSVFRKFNKSKKRSDKVLQAFNDEMDDIYNIRESVRKAVERKKKELAKLERNKKILKIGLPIVAGSVLIGGGLALNKKKKGSKE